jgi:hypothetical protein
MVRRISSLWVRSGVWWHEVGGRKISRSGDAVDYTQISGGWGMAVLLFSLP